MKIKPATNSPNFGVKLNTGSVLEVTSMKIFQNEGIKGFKEVTEALNPVPIKFVGNRGYRYYAKIIGEKIIKKYPEIAQATAQIREIAKNNPYFTKAELNQKIQPIIEKLGQEIDINL